MSVWQRRGGICYKKFYARRIADFRKLEGCPTEVEFLRMPPVIWLLWLCLLALPAAGEDAVGRHLRELKQRLPHAGFIYTVQSPFVVVGDLPRRELDRYARGTVGWAVRHLKQQYFARDPQGILDVWLFRDADSYGRHVKLLTGTAPDTPYGFYSPRHRGLFMNIHTGGGTLVHELVHPFIQANFPNCPPWFNEGLASLYEQCGEKDGRMVGYTNWRLAGLQSAIRAHQLGSFETLMGLDEDGFYSDQRGQYYAQARYLCYYLQEQGLLEAFYRKLSNGTDRSGGASTLKELLGFPNWQEFQANWQAWVLDLRFNG